MLTARKLINGSTAKILAEVNEQGYAHIKQNYFLTQKNNPHLPALQKSYDQLSLDTESPGSRYRAYTNYFWDTYAGRLIQNPNNDYYQPKSYNYVDGDKVRKFDHIQQGVLDNQVMQQVLERDVALAQNSGLVTFKDDLQVGLHQIRYAATKLQPAYSSPSWLHRDNEPFVFVHLLNITRNTLGGDNVLAEDVKTINNVLRLQKPLDTLLVSRKNLHAVTPVGSANNKTAFRDVMLVTFQNVEKLAGIAFFQTKKATPAPEKVEAKYQTPRLTM